MDRWVARAVAIMTALGLLTGCSAGYSYPGPGAVSGSGRLTSRAIDLSGGHLSRDGSTFVVHLKTGSSAQATVPMDDNLTDRVEATVSGHELRLRMKSGISVRTPVRRASRFNDQRTFQQWRTSTTSGEDKE